jgi:hypothetical protein
MKSRFCCARPRRRNDSALAGIRASKAGLKARMGGC